MNQYNLKQIIRDPTHYTDNISSLIDLFLFRNTASILYSGVIDPFTHDQVRYHCPILVLLKFLRSATKPIKRKIWNYERADFNKLCALLSPYDLVNKLESDRDIDNNLNLTYKSSHSRS